MNNLKDEELIRELKRAELAEHLTRDDAGAERIFALLIERHQRPFARLLAIKYPLDISSAEKMTQDFWLECYSALPRYNPDRPFLAWATTILFRTAEKFIKKRRKEIQLSPQNTFFDLQVAQSDSPELESLERGQIAAMLTGLRELPSDLAQLIELRFFENRKIDEIIELTGLARSTIFERLNLAYKKLRRHLDENS